MPTCAILAIPVQSALACWAGTLVAARSVDTAKAAASPVDAALIHICGEEQGVTDQHWWGRRRSQGVGKDLWLAFQAFQGDYRSEKRSNLRPPFFISVHSQNND